MNTFIILGLVCIIALGVIVRLVIAMIDEVNGYGGADEDGHARRPEERKNERIRKEIEQWREGR